MKIVITGGTGFLGRLIAERALDRGDSVTLFDIAIPPDGLGALEGRAEMIAGDIADTEMVARVIEKSDAVVHLASMVSAGSGATALPCSVANGHHDSREPGRAKGPARRMCSASGSEGPSRAGGTSEGARKPPEARSSGAAKSSCIVALGRLRVRLGVCAEDEVARWR